MIQVVTRITTRAFFRTLIMEKGFDASFNPYHIPQNHAIKIYSKIKKKYLILSCLNEVKVGLQVCYFVLLSAFFESYLK